MEQQSHYVGLDVSLETTSICVIDDAGAIIWRGKCSSDPDTITAEAEIATAFQTLVEHGYRHLPVVEDGHLVGLVSMRDTMRVAHIQPVEHPSQMDAPRGLEGLIVAETEVGDVRGQEGFYHYRQYNAVELAEKRSLEDVWYLLYYGKLPTKEEREKFIEEKRQYREVPPKVKKPRAKS